MKKTIKHIIATTLIISSFSAFAPVKYFNLVATKAYAETYTAAQKGELNYLQVTSGSGNKLPLKDEFEGNETGLSTWNKYFIDLADGSDTVKISGTAATKDYVVKVFDSDGNYVVPYNTDEEIKLTKGVTDLYVRTYTSEHAFESARDDHKLNKDYEESYKISVRKVDKNSDNGIYLYNLTLDSGSIPLKFDEKTYEYNLTVKESIDYVTVKAEPDKSSYTVKVNARTLSDAEDYKRDFPLNIGNNVLKIRVLDDNDIKVYTVNINRGGVNTNTSGTSTNNTTAVSTSTSNEDIKIIPAGGSTNTISTSTTSNSKIGWIQNNGLWNYIDSSGTTLKNSWVYDNTYGKWYYLNETGVMSIGWKSINGSLYYFNPSGDMAKDTVIDGYKIGSDGALIR